MQHKLDKIDSILRQKEKKLNTLYELVKNNGSNSLIDSMVSTCKLEDSKENRLAAITRIVTLREDSIVTAMETEGKDKEFIKEAKHALYEIVKEYHIDIHKQTIDSFKDEDVLSPFYIALLEGFHAIGIILSTMQPLWTKHIIQTCNASLLEKYGSTQEVLNFLHVNNLLDTYKGEVSDRCYSVLVEEDRGYKVKSYAEAFPNQTKELALAFDLLIKNLSLLDDVEYNQKEAFLNYFKALKIAFTQKDTDKLIASWMDVDRAWMGITSPIQVSHPLEYYEDHLRKAVALEWDVRINSPKQSSKTIVKDDILKMFEHIYTTIEKDKNIFHKCVQNINRVQLYIGRLALYYGAQFQGLFSAQVVPNDENVSKECGKKIFAFADNILESQRAKPFLKIHTDIFGKEFLEEFRDVLFNKEELWHKVYATSTIGHEFGHILWLDDDTEKKMNASGMFKNIEEFKATTGGLVAFFMNEKEELKLPLLRDTVERAIRLISWMKTGEVEPYYCEGLMHLCGLFESGVLSFDNRLLTIDISTASYQRVKQWYITTYTKLAKHYLEKQDAKLFLEQYTQKESGFFMPKATSVKYFVNYYWNLHISMGRVLEESL